MAAVRFQFGEHCRTNERRREMKGTAGNEVFIKWLYVKQRFFH